MKKSLTSPTLRQVLLAACGTLAVFSAGCTGELQTGGPGSDIVDNGGSPDAGAVEPDPDPGTAQSTAQGLFDSNVAPVLEATCSPGGACHSSQDPAFVAAQRVNAYSTIIPYRDRLFAGYNAATADLLTKGNGTHNGASFSATDISAIQAWLAAEQQEAVPGQDEPSALAVWSGCMNLDDWTNENVAGEWANKNAGNDSGRCEACHNLGADGFIASDQNERVFEVITTSPAFMPAYFTLDATGTNVVINRARFENVGNQLAPHEAHGPFSVDGNAMDALQRFYDLTVLRQQAGQCEPPRF